MKNIGVKDNLKLYQTLIIVAFGVFTVLTIIFWFLVYGDYYNNNLYFNGREVEAEIVEIICVDTTPDEGSPTYSYKGVYKYVSPEGKEYSGLYATGGSQEYAEALIGSKITIVIDPNGTDCINGTLSSLSRYKNNIYTDLPLACVFTGLFCISSYLFFYRVLYCNSVDKKILKQVDGRFVNNCVSKGEVVKTFGLIWFYIKVRYEDKDETQEKWARSWFTRKEAKFLEQKKFINIVPYKNTYGILEEMPTEIKQ